MLLPLLCMFSCSANSGGPTTVGEAANMALIAPVLLPIGGMFALAEAQAKAERARYERERNKRKDGPFTEYWQKGKKSSGKRAEGTYKNKELDGLYSQWWPNGQKWKEQYFREGSLVRSTIWNSSGQKIGESNNGKSTRWYESGQMEQEIYKDGRATKWYENGQKQAVLYNYKGGLQGINTYWHENGQKSCVQDYSRASNKSFVKYWNNKGEEVETYEESGMVPLTLIYGDH